GAAPEGRGRLTLLDGTLHRNIRVTAVTADAISFRDAKGKARKVPLDDVVGLTFPGEADPPPPGPADVAVLLRGGDVIQGALLPGKEEEVGLSSPLLGAMRYSVDALTEIRFLEAWRASTEKPTYSEKERERDVFVYRNLDRLVGTFLRLKPGKVIVHGRIGDNYPIDFRNLLAVRFAEAPEEAPPAGRLAVLRLADGSRITATSISSDAKSVKATTVRDEKLTIRMEDVLALHLTGGRFVYLSDLAPKETKIVPWIGEVYSWDRPRFDRSFLDGSLRAGGETYLKGIGVISGTSLTWPLDGKFKRFVSRIALDDAAGEEGDVVFEVLVDGESKYRSGPQTRLAEGAEPARIPPIDLAGAKAITLRVSYVDDFVMDFADWIEPMLIR
ncbi:MAG: NPCBM/NEW2 domain-containing protein, partial [Planctomycetota bacterium]